MKDLQSIQERKEYYSNALSEISTLIGEEKETLHPINGENVRPGIGLDFSAKNLVIRAKDLDEGVFKVIVFGQFKRGKSTLLNALLKQDVLPTDNLECTAIITIMLNRQDTQEVRIVKIDGEDEYMKKDEFKVKYALNEKDRETLNSFGLIDRFENIQYAEIPSDSKLCRNGVMLIDAPGLKASSIREKIANEYLRQSHAVIFMLDAIYPLDKDEQKFIRNNFEPGQMENIFFVVNRINLLNSDEERDKLKRDIKQRLTPYYEDEDGSFLESLYNERVFFVNAKQAQEATSKHPIDNLGYEQSGVASFENSLAKYLSGDEKANAIFDETKKYVAYVINEAEQAVSRQISMLKSPLPELEQQVKIAETQLKIVESKKSEASRIIKSTAEKINEKLGSSLLEHINEMRQTWDEDAALLNFEEVFSVGNVAGAFWERIRGDKEAFIRRFEPEIKELIGGYMKDKLDVWAKEKAPLVVGEDLETMQVELEEFLREFSLQLDEISVGVPDIESDAASELQNLNASQWIQLIMQTILMGDPGGAVKTIYSKGSWSDFIVSLVQQTIAVGLLVGVIGGPIGWILFGIWELVQIDRGVSKFADKIREKIGTCFGIPDLRA